MAGMTPGSVLPPVQQKRTRPEDVDTAFWLWLVALPLLVGGYLCDVFTTGDRSALMTTIATVFAVLFAVVLVTVVLTFLILLRAGYRWARTVLTAGALTSIVVTASSLFGVQRPTTAALVYAGTGIVGAVLLTGGVVLLHRADANAYFTR